MNDPVMELLLQLPVAGLLLLVVLRFLQFIKERDENWLFTVRQRDEQFIMEVGKMQDALREQNTHTLDALIQNTTMMGHAARSMERVDDHLRKLGYERDQDEDRRIQDRRIGERRQVGG